MKNGHQNLINDLTNFLKEAQAGEFGDFTNEKYPVPKMALSENLLELRQNVIDGRYDDQKGTKCQIHLEKSTNH